MWANSSDNWDLKFTSIAHFWFFQFPMVQRRAASKTPSMNCALTMPAWWVSFLSTQPGLISLLLLTRIQQKLWDATSGRRWGESGFCLCCLPVPKSPGCHSMRTGKQLRNYLHGKNRKGKLWFQFCLGLTQFLWEQEGTRARGPS